MAQHLSSLELENLRVEYKVNPIGIDERQPRLSWQIVSSERGVRQKAYQIRAAATSANLEQSAGLLWDTGKVASDQSIHVVYRGPALQSRQRVFWQVRVWNEKDEPSAWSAPAYWEMGLLQPSDWQAAWIQPDIAQDLTKSQPCPMLRKEFTIAGAVKSARVYVTCLGLYEMELNGRRVGANQVFTPGWTSYDTRLQYQTYEVTSQLRAGKNAIGAILGDGWYRGHLTWDMRRNVYGDKPALLLQLHVVYEDGSTQIITTDETWKAATGPILSSDIYNGEIYDARLEKKGWSAPDFNDTGWSGVKIIAHSKAILVAPAGPAVRKIQEIKPVAIIKTPAGETVFDMGQNLVGWVRLKARGRAGTTVTLRHAEVLDKAGNFYSANLRKAGQKIQYTLKGDGIEVYEPHFTFQGFRYVLMEGFPGEPALENLTGIVIHSDMTPTGSFECSHPLINRLQHNIQWGQRGNFLDVPTDCPQRDERLGWTGDAQAFCRTAAFNFDVAGFFTKWLHDLAADQKNNGSVPWVIPDVLSRGQETGGGSTGWADAATIIPWTIYLCYGDRRILENQYESMKAWVEYVREQAGDDCIHNQGFHFGDWLAYSTDRSDYPGATTDKDLIATAFFAHSTSLLAKTAKALAKEDDVTKYSALLDKIKQAFRQEYVTPNGRLASNTQTAYALALAFDLLPANLRPGAAQRLANDVKAFQNHLTTGFLGTPHLCHALSSNGYLEVAYALLLQETYPSWLYPVKMGATTIWERWDGIKPNGAFQDAGMNSFNHYAYGAIGEWLYRVVAGIEIDPEQPGYKHILIQPQPGGNLTHARASLLSMYGKIESAWKIAEARFSLAISVPANTRATVRLPFADMEKVRESNQPLSKAKGISSVRQDGDAVVVEVGSGSYVFAYPFNETPD
jgi:alpha-L-rhamnosidase